MLHRQDQRQGATARTRALQAHWGRWLRLVMTMQHTAAKNRPGSPRSAMAAMKRGRPPWGSRAVQGSRAVTLDIEPDTAHTMKHPNDCPFYRGDKLSSRGVRWGDLPPDMKVIVDDFFFSERVVPGVQLHSHVSNDTVLPTRTVRVKDHLAWAQSLEWDERGPEQVERMAEEYRRGGRDLPPVVIYKGEMLDGRHRVLAAEKAGVRTLPSIHLEDLPPIVDQPVASYVEQARKANHRRIDPSSPLGRQGAQSAPRKRQSLLGDLMDKAEVEAEAKAKAKPKPRTSPARTQKAPRKDEQLDQQDAAQAVAREYLRRLQAIPKMDRRMAYVAVDVMPKPSFEGRGEIIAWYKPLSNRDLMKIDRSRHDAHNNAVLTLRMNMAREHAFAYDFGIDSTVGRQRRRRMGSRSLREDRTMRHGSASLLSSLLDKAEAKAKPKAKPKAKTKAKARPPKTQPTPRQHLPAKIEAIKAQVAKVGRREDGQLHQLSIRFDGIGPDRGCAILRWSYYAQQFGKAGPLSNAGKRSAARELRDAIASETGLETTLDTNAQTVSVRVCGDDAPSGSRGLLSDLLDKAERRSLP